jgi:A/G-specific adenine glycosylase
MVVDSLSEVSHRILDWFSVNARVLPWRNPPGVPLPLDDPDWPYRVWLSEVMLQQTTVAAVKAYFQAFTRRWPSVRDLAAAQDGDVMAAWAGLGYYARARNMLACARIVADSGFPSDEAELRALPGIGDYTAAAIASIAFGQRAVVVDGNVERVISRLFAVETPMPAAKPILKALAAHLTPDERAGDYAQGMMDLGATICTPRNPACGICPVNDLCKGRTQAERFPIKPPKSAKPARKGVAWWIEQGDQVMLVRRPDKGLLGGMLALPSCDWKGGNDTPPVRANWRRVGDVAHVFTHFSLSLEILSGSLNMGCTLPPGAQWWPKDRIAEAGLPTLFAKAAALVMSVEEDRL